MTDLNTQSSPAHTPTLAPTTWDESVDFLVVGSGAGGMTAALTAKHQGLSTLVIEKSEAYGGTTAVSGGVIWLPNNQHMAKAGIADSFVDAQAYLQQVVSADVARPRLRAYIQQSIKMLAFLEKNSHVKYQAAAEYPDYYPELEGGKQGARSLDPQAFSVRELGDELAAQMRHDGVKRSNGFSLTADEAHKVFSFTWKSNLIIIKRVLAYWLDIPRRLKGLPDSRLTLGRALIGRLRRSLVDSDIPLWLNTPAIALIKNGDKVVGVRCEKDGRPFYIEARKGVLLATGGFSHDAALRGEHHPDARAAQWTAAMPCDSGDGIHLGQAAGAQLAMMDYAWWTPTMIMPSGFVEALIMGKSMPGCMAVNQAGQRFCNEASPYEDFVKAQYAAHTERLAIIITQYQIINNGIRKHQAMPLAVFGDVR